MRRIARVQSEDRLINQLQQNIIGAIEPIFQSLTGSFVFSLTGCTTTPAVLVSWQKATADGPVTLCLSSLNGTSNTTAATLTGLPVVLWPTSSQVVLVKVEDNGTWAVGLMTITVSGVVTLYKDTAGSAFTNSGTKGIGQCSVTYATGI